MDNHINLFKKMIGNTSKIFNKKTIIDRNKNTQNIKISHRIFI